MEADQIFCFTGEAQWAKTALQAMDKKACCYNDFNQLVKDISIIAKPGDHILIMSNGSFGGIHGKILMALQNHSFC